MCRKRWMWVGVWLLASCAFGQTRPPSPFISRGACPFECCTYREWTVLQPMRLVDQPGGQTVVARLQKGERVMGLTGEVHSIPLPATYTRAKPIEGLRRGDTVYLLHNLGEGSWRVWRQGKLMDMDMSWWRGKYPQYTWWVKVRTRQGVEGWVISNRNFGNQDRCG